MNSNYILLFCLFFGINFTLRAESVASPVADSAFSYAVETGQLESITNAPLNVEVQDQFSHYQNSKLALKYKAAFHENKRLTAAMLTFALGMLGVHRLYLGTQPWIPAVYLLTFGGGFLILPLIDLGVILFCKDISVYEHNDKVLMWVK